jgi:tRNA pseudouridine65 synthase
MAISVLWRGENVFVVDKPSGMLVHSSAWAGPPERSVVDEVREHVDVAASPVHRLDRQTSGALMFATTSAAARALQTAWPLPSTAKTYLAIVRGHVKTTVDIDHPLDDPDDPGHVGGKKPARSVVVPIAVSSVERCSLVEVRVFSGRRHQVRRHLKHISHPILGDASYGKGPLNRDYRDRYGLSRMALHAHRIVVKAEGFEPVDVVAPLAVDLSTIGAALFGW